MKIDPTNAERQRRWRARKANKLPPVQRYICTSCGKLHTGTRGDDCYNCFLKTDAGREYERIRKRNRNKSKK